MRMKKLVCVLAGLGFIACSGGTLVAAPSAKFAAVWNTGGVDLASVSVLDDVIEDGGYVDNNGNGTYDEGDTIILNSKSGYTLATIKVPQDKELLVGVSAEIGLVTDTSIRGKLGGSAKAIADAGASVIVSAVPLDGSPAVIAAPGGITLSRRVQELEATLGGVIESCADTTGAFDIDGNPIGDGTITVADECVVTDEQIGLVLDTLAAHHFNFVLPNLDSGEYAIKALFTTSAGTVVDIDESSVIVDNNDTLDDPADDTQNIYGSAYAKAFVGKSMLTVQQVRAVKGSLPPVDGGVDIEIEP